MTLLQPGLVGRQEPRFLSRPEFDSSAFEEVVVFCRAMGMVLDPWQELCLEVALGDVGGEWAATEVGVIVPRQNGKGEILAARELAGLFVFHERLILHSAHEFKTAREHFIRVLGYLQAPGNEWMLEQVKTIHRSHGEEGIELHNGNRLNFVARSTGSMRGMTGDCVVLDEAYALNDLHMAAVISTLSARSIEGNPQIWYTSSAPLETSIVLHRLRKRGRVGDPRFAYLEWSAESADEPDAVKNANPALGIRISEAFVETERGSLSREGFERERLGIAPDIDGEAAIPLEKWRAVLGKAKPGEPVAFAVDCTPDRRYGAIATADAQVVELVDHRPGVGWVVARCFELWERWGCKFVVDASGPAGSLGAELERLGGTVEYLGPRDIARACNAFHDDVVDARFTVLDPFGSTTPAVLGAIKKPSGDTWRWGRTIDVDISPLMAITIARWAAADPPASFEPLVAWR
jgi:hypothetical protein